MRYWNDNRKSCEHFIGGGVLAEGLQRQILGGFVAADAAGAAACGLPLSSQPVNDSPVSSARDSAAKRNGFILLTPRPAGRIH